MKIAIIGAGNVGASAAAFLLVKKIAKKIALVDIAKDAIKGKALDLSHVCALLDINAKIKSSSEYDIIKNADICVITAGFPRKDGDSRDMLLAKNTNIVASASEQIAKYAPNSVIIVVSNPLDAMVYAAFKASKFPKERVFGMAGELDSARMKFLIASEFKAGNSSIKACILGQHGANMKAQFASVNGVQLRSEKLVEFCEQTKNAGGEIIKLLGTSAYYAPAAGIAKMCKAIKQKRAKTLICSALGKDGIPCGKEVIFGKKTRILEPKIDLSAAKSAIKANCEKIDEILKERK